MSKQYDSFMEELEQLMNKYNVAISNGTSATMISRNYTVNTPRPSGIFRIRS